MKRTLLKDLNRIAGAFLLTAAMVSTASADYISTMTSLGPVGWWRFTNTPVSTLTIVTNGGSLGSAATGYVVESGSDTPKLGQPGLIGTCATFYNPGNTVGNCDSKIEVPFNAALNANPPFSIEFWANPNSLGADSTGFSPLENFNPSGNSGGSRRGWLFYLNSAGRWNFRLGAYSGYALNLAASSGNATPGTWEHIVATWDGTNVVLYGNGVVIGSGAAASPGNGGVWVPNTVSFLRFGGSPLTGNNAEYNAISGTSTIGNRGYDGSLQHVAIYNKVLTPTQVNAHYSASSTNTSGYTKQIMADAPVGYWPLNDPAITAPTTTTVAVNSGSDGASANGTIYPGVQSQFGPGYSGFGSDTNALFFDGVNGYLQVADTGDLNGGNAAIQSGMTLTAWVKPIAQDYFHDIIARGFDATSGEDFLRISRGPFFSGSFANFATDPSGDDGQYYEFGTTDGQNYYDAAQFQIAPGDIGNWVFLAGTWDGSNWNLYRNGQLVATVPADTTDGDMGPYLAAQQWTIGSRAPDAVTAGSADPAFPGQTESFQGSIHEPAIFNTALTASQILNLYLAAQPSPVFTVAPQNPGAVYQGQSVAFSAYAEGSPTITYAWISNGIPTGVTSTNFAINNIGSGIYTIGVIASNPYGSTTNQVTFTVVAVPPSIVASPLPQVRYVGYPFSLSVGAVGSSPLTYTWKLGSSVVQTGSSSNYTATASLANGGSYTVVIANAAGSITSAPVVVTVKSIPASTPVNYPATVLASGPISYWRLDETSGTTAYDAISGNNGVYNSATLGLPGYVTIDPDTAVGFSGANSYIGNISGTAINFTNNAPFTLEAWVKGTTGMPDQSTIIAKGIGNNGTTETEQFALDVSGGNYRFFTTHAGNVYAASGSTGPDGTWQHVVGVYNNASLPATLTLYVNGAFAGSGTATFAQSTTVTPVTIGSKRTGNDPSYDGTFNGTIDEVAVYNYALDATTVFNHYTSAYGANTPPTITIQPNSSTNYIGLPVSLAVSGFGSAPLTYTWYKGTAPGGTQVGTGPTYSVTAVAATDAGSYYCNLSNGAGSTNTASVQIVALAAPTSPPSISGLVVHLPFNGSLSDVTGRGNNGTGIHKTQYPTTTTTLSPSSATAPSFYYVPDGPFSGSSALHYSTVATNSGGLAANGTSGGTNDYYVSLGVRPDLQFSSNVSFTVSYWIRMPQGFGVNAPNGGDLPFFTTVTNSTGGWGYCFTMAYGYGTANPVPTTAPAANEVGAWGASIYDAAGTGIRYYGDNYDVINDGNWHNLVQIVNRSTGKFTTYIDGLVAIEYLDAGTTLNATGNIDNGAPATIGQDPTGLYGEDGAFDIADFGVWRKAFTPLEASSIYEAGINNLSFTGTPPGPSSITINGSSISGSAITFNWSALPAGSYTYSVLSRTNLVSGNWVTNATGLSTTSYTDSSATLSKKFYRVTSP